MYNGMAARAQNLARQNIVRIFSSSYNTNYYYPYRLAMAGKVTDQIRNSCLELIVDSNIEDEDVTNEEVIHDATRFHADFVIPKDYIGEIDASYESTREFIDLWKDRPECHATIIAPLQPPYRQHYSQYEEFYSQFSHFCLGGISNIGSPREQLTAINEFRDLIGQSAYLHGLGVGTRLEFIKGLRKNPQLLDSLDISTPEIAPACNALPDKSMTQVEYEFPSGDDSSIIRGQFAQAVLHLINYLLSPMTDDDAVVDAYEQSALADYHPEEGESDDWDGGFVSKATSDEAQNHHPKAHTPADASSTTESQEAAQQQQSPAQESKSASLGDF